MELIALLSLVAMGMLAGLLSGLVGVGGGVVIVPFLYVFYAHAGWSGVQVGADAATLAAHATSLFVILPTSVRGAVEFHRQRMVEWRLVWPVGLTAAVAAVVASQLALRTDPRFLRLGFGVLLLYSAWRLFRSASRRRAAAMAARPVRRSGVALAGTGVAVGFFSAMLGVGGGVVAIQLLMQVVRLEVKRLAATSIAIVAITSAAGVAAYMASGAPVQVRPGWSIGHVDVAAALALTAGTLVSVRWGARLNRKLSARRLSLVFGTLFLVLGGRLVLENVLG
jgi:uncharacterized protein